MNFVLMNSFAGNRADYAAKLTTALMQSYSGSDADAIRALIAGGEAKLPIITPPDALPKPAANQAQQVDALMADAIEHLRTAAPLLTGETIEQDAFSILAEPFGSYPSGTAVLHRRTNLAETCFFFPNVTVVSGRLRIMPLRGPAEDDTVEDGPFGVVEGLIIAAAKKLAQMLGTALLAELFPEKMPSYFVEVFARIKKIVQDGLSRQTVDELEGEFGGVLRFVKNEYEPEKDKSGVTPDLLKRLQDKSDRMYDQVGRIMPERFSLSGLPVFLFGASVHLSMLQEIAIQKQKLNLVGEKPSGQTFEDYPKHTEATYTKLSDARNKGRVGKDQKCSASGGGGGVVCNWYVFWKDEISGKTSGQYFFGCGTPYKNEDAARVAAKKALDQHLAAEVAALKKSLSDPPAVAKAWREAGKLLPG